MNTLTQRLSWHARRGWHRLTHLHLLVLALLALAIGLHIRVIAPLEARHAQLEQRLAETRRALPAPVRPDATPALPAPARDIAFLAFLPAAADREKQLERLHQVAADQGLRLTRIDYRTTRLTELPVEQLDLRFSVQGDATALRVFLERLLRQLPNLAVRRLGLERGDQGQTTLTLDASLYLRVEDPR